MRAFAQLGFRGRLLLAMMSVVLMTGLTLLLVFMLYLLQDEKQRAAESLDVAERVTLEIMERRSEVLLASLQVLVDDFGFRSAVASGDSATIASVLENHASRAGADVAVIMKESGAPLIALGQQATLSDQPFPGLLQTAREQGMAARVISFQDNAYQMFMVPIRAAGLRAWLAAGFVLDEAFASTLGGLTGTGVMFKQMTQGSASVLTSSGVEGSLSTITGQLPAEHADKALLETDRYFVRAVDLNSDLSAPVRALLLINRDEALARYWQRATGLLLIVLLALVLAGVIVLFTARALGRPVLQLARFAADIGEGRTTETPLLPSTRELNTLHRSLDTMQQKIRDREARIRFNAVHDELTGLSNRRAVMETLAVALKTPDPLWLIGVRLNRFKALNDTLGIRFGDQVLNLVASRLKTAHVGRTEVIARTGGAEFSLVIRPGDTDSIPSVLNDIRDLLEAQGIIDDTPVHLQVAVGALVLPRDAKNLDEVRRRFGLAIDQAERSVRHIATYQPGGDELHLRELTLSQDLQHALAENALDIHYQPKVRLADGAFVQVEALARWQHPTLGFISPDEFILLAERTGQIGKLTRFILARIAADQQQWRGQGLNHGVAINLSALDLTDTTLAGDVARAFSDLSSVTFEITESAVMSDPRAAMQTLEQLRALGANLSVDDFGTGYSSLSQLRQLPVQELKIDKSFVMKLEKEPQDQLIVRSTIDMAHGLGLSVVAEGIENEASWTLLRAWGCEKGQGYFMARPMPSGQLADWATAFRERSADLITGSPPTITGDTNDA